MYQDQWSQALLEMKSPHLLWSALWTSQKCQDAPESQREAELRTHPPGALRAGSWVWAQAKLALAQGSFISGLPAFPPAGPCLELVLFALLVKSSLGEQALEIQCPPYQQALDFFMQSNSAVPG